MKQASNKLRERMCQSITIEPLASSKVEHYIWPNVWDRIWNQIRVELWITLD